MKGVTYKVIEINKPSPKAVKNLNKGIYEIITQQKCPK